MRPLPRLGLLVAAVAASALVAGCGDDEGARVGDTRAEQVRTAAVDAGLDDDVADFLALAARGDTATYRATYPGASDAEQLVVTNRPPDRRVDVVVDGTTTEVRLVVDGQALRCTPGQGLASGRCERTDAFVEPPGVFAVGAVEELRDALVARLDDYLFELETIPVAGVEATCLVTRVRTGRNRPELGDGGTICLAPEGPLLLVDQAGERLEATDYTTDVGDDDPFVRPDRDLDDAPADP